MKQYFKIFVFILVLTVIFPPLSHAEPQAIEAQAPPATDTQKFANLRINPIGLLFFIIGAELDLGLGRSWTLGPSFSMLRVISSNALFVTTQAGLTGTYYFSGHRYTNSFIARASGYYVPVSVTQTANGQEFNGQLTGAAFGALGGYQWWIGRGLNFALGAGIAYYFTGAALVAHAPNSETRSFDLPYVKGIEPNLEVSFGYAL